MKGCNARYRQEVLETALRETEQVTDTADRLNGLFPGVNRVVAGLDLKTRSIVGMLQEIAWVEGESVGVSFGNDIMCTVMHDYETIDQGLTDLSDDPDIIAIGEAYRLARMIRSKEYRICHGQDDDADFEDVGEPRATKDKQRAQTDQRPQTSTQADAVETLPPCPDLEEDPEDEVSLPLTGIPAMDRYLDQLDYGKQAMARTLIDVGWYNGLMEKIHGRLCGHLESIDTTEGIEEAFRGDPEIKAEHDFWTGFRAAAARAHEEI